MFKSLSIALGAFAVLSASPVAAHPFDSFVKMCMNTDANADRAGSAARAAGWSRLPEEVVADMGSDFRDAAAFSNVDPARLDPARPPETIEMLITGWGAGADVLGVDDINLDVCGLFAMGETSPEMERRMTAYLGWPVALQDDYRIWLYSRDGDRIIREDDLLGAEDEVIADAARQRRIFAVFVMDEAEGSGLLVGAVHASR